MKKRSGTPGTDHMHPSHRRPAVMGATGRVSRGASVLTPKKPSDLKQVNEFEAAEILDISVHTLRYWRTDKVNKGPRFVKSENGNVRYPLRWLAQYQEEHAVNTSNVVNFA